MNRVVIKLDSINFLSQEGLEANFKGWCGQRIWKKNRKHLSVKSKVGVVKVPMGVLVGS